MATIENEEKPGTPSVFSCPECNGTLWEMHNGDLIRFRCRVGHAFSIESMDAKQAEMLESALWAALRALEERIALERRLSDQARLRNHDKTADRFKERAQVTEHHAAQIRQILLSNKHTD